MTYTITVHIDEKNFTPDNEEYHRQLIRHYLESKGVALKPYMDSNAKNTIWLEVLASLPTRQCYVL